jgi:hypothetical protein
MSAQKMFCDYGHECLRAVRLILPDIINAPGVFVETLCAYHWGSEMIFRRAINRRAIEIEKADPRRQRKELPILSFREEAKLQRVWLAKDRRWKGERGEL